MGSGAAGRAYAWLATFVALMGVGSAWFVLADAHESVRRSPAAISVPQARPAAISVVGGVAHIVSRDAREQIIPDTVPPGRDEPATLLWLSGKPTSPSPDGALAVDAGGSVVAFDARLRPRRPRLELGGRLVASVAAAGGGTLWIVDATGTLLRTGKRGEIVHEGATPFAFASVFSAADGSRAWIARSQERFGYAWDSSAALVVSLRDDGSVATRIGAAVLPQHVMLQDIANAGRMAVDHERLFFAPFIRDEIVSLGISGDTAWVASRDLPQSTSEPRFEVNNGKVVVDYHPVNLGAAIGPDGLLYVLSTPGFSTTRSRLDAFDPETGHLARTAQLATAVPTIAVDASGRVYLLDETRLLTGTAPGGRQRFPEIDLATSAGDSVTSATLEGHVTLVNLWASWCKPCRDEMPALDTLRRALLGDSFRFVSINGDASTSDATGFLREVGIEMPYAIAGPGLTRRFHAPGLPYTVLLDREGRVVQSWLGFSGPEQIGAIRAAALLEVGRLPAASSHSHH